MLCIKRIRDVFVLSALSLLTACGTYTPIPAQGGGKRFAIEQAMISASARHAIAAIPYEKLVGKNVAVEVSVIQDEGGGFIGSGGRPFALSILSAQLERLNAYSGGSTQQGTAGFRAAQSEPVYTKDINYNASDAKQFTSLLLSALFRKNILINLQSTTIVPPDYTLEVLVDVFGIWRSRTDWLVYNAETLTATTSLEYVITPLNNPEEKREVGRVGFDATYKERYSLWMGPFETTIDVVPSQFSKFIGTFGEGEGGYSNLGKVTPNELIPLAPPAPIILNPTDARTRQTGPK